MKVFMTPSPTESVPGTSGIHAVVNAYARHFPEHGIEFVGPETSFDVEVVHAGVKSFEDTGGPNLMMCHGLNWTADYPGMTSYEFESNAYVIDAIRHARLVSVPSDWVAETFRRDMHLDPRIVPHGIDWGSWQHNEENGGFFLWNKNRMDSVCDPSPIEALARRFPAQVFVSTFARRQSENLYVSGVLPTEQMKNLIQRAGVYVATTRETFGIGTLEAMASGVPILGFAHGGILDLVEHGVHGYLARPGDIDDLIDGAHYCVKYGKQLGENGRERAKEYDWSRVVPHIVEVIRDAARPVERTVSIVIPVYNKAGTVERAIRSALDQTRPPEEIIVVDDGSTDDSGRVAERLAGVHGGTVVKVLRHRNQGVAIARNTGIAAATGSFICALDADDAIRPSFIERTLLVLSRDNSLGIAYTGLTAILPDGSEQYVDSWPPEYNYNNFLLKQNQVPTCCLFRKEAWRRAGGFRQRYAPNGAGAEDAELWLRMGSQGWGAQRVTDEGLFLYTVSAGVTSDNYVEPPWLEWHPWTQDGIHPFASMATPVNQSHAVRQYDTPLVSVIIPVGPGHETFVVNALDSLEAQTLRQWEAVVVDDTEDDTLRDMLRNAHPFVRYIRPGQGMESGTEPGKKVYISHGAGKARNIGAEKARGPLFLFLDADDWLVPTALEKMVAAYRTKGGEETVVYSDYYGIEIVADELPDIKQDDIVFYDERTKKLVVHGHLPDYSYRRAMEQPQNPPYVWTSVTCLFGRDYFIPFDEHMPSWEDWKWTIDMARKGYYFHRIDEPLFVYNFHTGRRRQTGNPIYQQLMDYIDDRKGEAMACHKCGDDTPKLPGLPQNLGGQQGATIDAGDIEVKYLPQIGGMHMVWGNTAPKRNYGRHGSGDVFRVSVRDVVAQPHLFVCPSCGNRLKVAGGRVWCDCKAQQDQPKVIAEHGVFVKPGDPFSRGQLVKTEIFAPRATPPPPGVQGGGFTGLTQLIKSGPFDADGGLQAPMAQDITRNPNPDSLGAAIIPDDDLTVVDGIGKTTQEKLYGFGIRTLARLSTLNEAQLKAFGVPAANVAKVMAWMGGRDA